jgi:hypothetical protein
MATSLRVRWPSAETHDGGGCAARPVAKPLLACLAYHQYKFVTVPDAGTTNSCSRIC